MRSLFSTILQFALSLVTIGLFASTSEGGHIVLDAGHGGVDPGAVAGPLKESALALKLTRMVQARLKEMGHVVTLTRKDESGKSLEHRARVVNGSYEPIPDALISLHLNSATDPKVSGFEVYLQNQLSLDEDLLITLGRERAVTEGHGHEQLSEVLELDRVRKSMLVQAEKMKTSATINRGQVSKSLSVAQMSDLKGIVGDLLRNSSVLLSAHLARTIVSEWRMKSPMHGADQRSTRAASVRQAPFFLLTHVAAPSVLVEIAYLTHPKESASIQQETVQNQVATTLADGIDKYLKRFASAP